jgi:histidinol-phosphate/aromatic aminotransferase/cobyric acid decarboxylase-like protein
VKDRLLNDARILIRSCDSYEGLEPGRFIRVAVRRRDENKRLVDALRRALK